MRLLFLSILVHSYFISSSQVVQTANDHVPEYEGRAFFGTNMGYFEGWTDEQLAEIAIGAPQKNIDGANMETIRPALFGHFLERWGYDIRVDAFEYYKELGFKDITCFIGEPSEEQREKTIYCSGLEPSHHFANLYEPIWDNGENGTPVNDNNYMALFTYKTVMQYKDHVKIWEIWNEPDLGDRDFKGYSEADPGQEGNWWDNNPDPCVYKLRAPVFHYIRTLRIAYEVIKSIDSNAFVAVGGLGHPSFLDAVMRNTDNPNDGQVDEEKFPLFGGAYFDMMSYHSYPHIDGSLRKWSNDINGFDYSRHSDRAVEGVFELRDEFREVLHKHGYDGQTFPKKKWMISEVNIPRLEVKDFIGSNVAQRNFMIKLAIESKKQDIKQLHIYNLAEGTKIHPTGEDEFASMGIFETLNGIQPYQHRKTEGGIAFQTVAKILKNASFDLQVTNTMNFKNGVKGAAFKYDNGEYIYALWAETIEDKNEFTIAKYTLPQDWGLDLLEYRDWTYGINENYAIIENKELTLDGSPIFIKAAKGISNPEKFIEFDVNPNPTSGTIKINYGVRILTYVSLDLINAEGKLIQQVLPKTAVQPGSYNVQINQDSLTNGVYFVRMLTTNDTFSKKIIKTE